ncbi:hypothetical protein [Glutamicibacter endophyticus]|uniref:hypothetical protein n=1 Tax=Glutamicibacter endophyticus TaxID=1522174 RepID=UPI003AF19B3C
MPVVRLWLKVSLVLLGLLALLLTVPALPAILLDFGGAFDAAQDAPSFLALTLASGPRWVGSLLVLVLVGCALKFKPQSPLRWALYLWLCGLLYVLPVWQAAIGGVSTADEFMLLTILDLGVLHGPLAVLLAGGGLYWGRRVLRRAALAASRSESEQLLAARYGR